LGCYYQLAKINTKLKKQKITNEIWIELQGNMLQDLLLTYPNNKKLNKVFEQNDILYHYTGLNGFLSIIETQSLFFSNVNFLNDSKEIKHGVDIVLKAIEETEKNETSDILLKMKENIDLLYKSEKYVTCFSKDGDLLSQWRAYGNNGKGISIGFEFADLTDSFDKYLTGTHIEYDETTQIESIKEYINLIVHFYKKIQDNYDWNGQDFNNLVAKQIITFFNNVIYSFKHPSFIDEREYRLQLEIDNKDDIDLKFRATENLIIPYTVLKNSYASYLETKESDETEPIFSLKKLPISKIIIGPSLDYETVKIGIKQFLFEKGYKEINIEKSNVPYRI
jgi:hypothetical protein